MGGVSYLVWQATPAKVQADINHSALDQLIKQYDFVRAAGDAREMCTHDGGIALWMIRKQDDAGYKH